jgi:Asp-tRNA(Asn)/Glu-tRNA(Gln) amidotransferase A subunit family amidase
MALHRLSLRAMLDGLRARQFTAEELTRDLLARIHALEPRLHAWAWLDGERALAAARGAGRGALGGIPVGIKDIVHVRGVPTGMGSPVFAGRIADESATVVKRLEAAGAFVLGKTVTAELAYFHPGPTRNPWNPAHTPGGSSMGSAAAVAAGMVPAALGTQTNGSVIRPAAFCGCVGYKPSAGLIPRSGMLEFSATLDQLGAFARSVEDAALVASVLVGHDPSDPGSLKNAHALADGLFLVAPPARPPRLAAVRSPVWHLAEAPQRAQFERDIRALRSAGAQAAEVELGEVFAQAHTMQRRILYVEGVRALGHLQAEHRARLSVALNRLLDEGRNISEAEYREALAAKVHLQQALQDFLIPFDALITPPARGEAPATLETTGDPAFCTIWTLCGVPALTIPSGFGPNHLPLGLQIVGRLYDDVRLLGIARWCAEAIGFDIGFPGA